MLPGKRRVSGESVLSAAARRAARASPPILRLRAMPSPDGSVAVVESSRTGSAEAIGAPALLASTTEALGAGTLPTLRCLRAACGAGQQPPLRPVTPAH